MVNHAGNSMRSQLVCNRPLRNEAVDEWAGVYKVPCQNCPKSYFGETGRPFNVRLGEHKSVVRKGDLRNACFKHISDTSHDIDWSNAKLLYSEDDWYRRLVLESSCMVICPNFNNMRSTLIIDQFSARLILKSCPEFDVAPPSIRFNFSLLLIGLGVYCLVRVIFLDFFTCFFSSHFPGSCSVFIML